MRVCLPSIWYSPMRTRLMFSRVEASLWSATRCERTATSMRSEGSTSYNMGGTPSFESSSGVCTLAAAMAAKLRCGDACGKAAAPMPPTPGHLRSAVRGEPLRLRPEVVTDAARTTPGLDRSASSGVSCQAHSREGRGGLARLADDAPEPPGTGMGSTGPGVLRRMVLACPGAAQAVLGGRTTGKTRPGDDGDLGVTGDDGDLGVLSRKVLARVLACPGDAQAVLGSRTTGKARPVDDGDLGVTGECGTGPPLDATGNRDGAVASLEQVPVVGGGTAEAKYGYKLMLPMLSMVSSHKQAATSATGTEPARCFCCCRGCCSCVSAVCNEGACACRAGCDRDAGEDHTGCCISCDPAGALPVGCAGHLVGGDAAPATAAAATVEALVVDETPCTGGVRAGVHPAVPKPAVLFGAHVVDRLPPSPPMPLLVAVTGLNIGG